jgi:hypothetical protein
MNPSRPAILAVAILASFALAACGASTVSSDELSSQAKSALENSVGSPLGSVDCPETDAEAGTTFECDATTPNGDQLKLEGTITEVDGDNVKFDIKVVS